LEEGVEDGRKFLYYGHFYISFPALRCPILPVLSHPPSYSKLPALSQLNSWPKVSFFALSWASSLLIHPLSTVGQMLYLLYVLLFASGLKRNLGCKWWHTEKEHCIESDSNGFLVRVIELDFAFSD
jgi:hypothetical protein